MADDEDHESESSRDECRSIPRGTTAFSRPEWDSASLPSQPFFDSSSEEVECSGSDTDAEYCPRGTTSFSRHASSGSNPTTEPADSPQPARRGRGRPRKHFPPNPPKRKVGRPKKAPGPKTKPKRKGRPFKDISMLSEEKQDAILQNRAIAARARQADTVTNVLEAVGGIREFREMMDDPRTLKSPQGRLLALDHQIDQQIVNNNVAFLAGGNKAANKEYIQKMTWGKHKKKWMNGSRSI